MENTVTRGDRVPGLLAANGVGNSIPDSDPVLGGVAVVEQRPPVQHRVGPGTLTQSDQPEIGRPQARRGPHEVDVRNRGIHRKHPEQIERRETTEAATDADGLDDCGRSTRQRVVIAARPNKEAGSHGTREPRPCRTGGQQGAAIHHDRAQLVEDFDPRHGGMLPQEGDGAAP